MSHNNATRITALCITAMMLSMSFTSCKGKQIRSASSTSAESSSSAPVSSEASSVPVSALSILNSHNTTSSTITSPASKYKAPKYDKKSYFTNDASKKETKIGINNKNIKGASIPSSAPGASIVKRTTIEGVDGSFYDAKIAEASRNLGGKTYTFATFWPENWKKGKNATQDAIRCASQLDAVQKDYNCKINIKALNANTYLKDVTTARTCGKVYADIIEMADEMSDMYTSGDCADLLGVKSVNVNGNPWNKAYILLTSYKNKDYGIGLRYDNISHRIMLFNKKMASKYNLGDFYGMAAKGQWTDDIFLQVSQQFKKVNNDKSVFNCVGLHPQEILDLVYTNWTSPFGITNTKYIFNGLDSSVLNILGYAQNFVKSGLYDTNFTKTDFSSDGKFSACWSDVSYAINRFNTSKALFLITDDTALSYFISGSKDPYGILPLPKGPAADDYTALIGDIRYFSLFEGNPEIENAGALLTAIANRTNVKTADVVNHNAAFVRDQESVTTLTNNYKYKQIIMGCVSSDFSEIYNGAAIKCVFKQETTPMQAMQSISKSAQTAIDKTYGQS